MARPALEIADIFRDHGSAWRQANAGHVSLGQLKVMSAIESCRTAALGGHVERCDDCSHTQIAYNSCLMGKSINGELACRHRHFSVNCSDLCLNNSAVLRLHRLRHWSPVTNRVEHVGDILLGIEDDGEAAERAERDKP